MTDRHCHRSETKAVKCVAGSRGFEGVETGSGDEEKSVVRLVPETPRAPPATVSD